MRRTFTLATAILVVAVLAANGSAAKHIDSIACSDSTGMTFTWAPGTTEIDYTLHRADGSVTGTGIFDPGNGPGSVTIPAPSDGATLNAIFGNKHGPAAEPAPVGCTA